MIDDNAPAFVLELEIDDEISFKPMHKTNKRALQTLDSNTLPIATPEKNRQIQKLQNTSSLAKVAQASTPSKNSTPLMKNSALSGEDNPTPIPVYTDLLENTHLPKYSQAELDSHKLEWQRESDIKLNHMSQALRDEVASKLQELQSHCDSLQMEKNILERQVTDLQASLVENRTDEKTSTDNQVKILSDLLHDAKVQRDSLQQQHEQTMATLKSSNDKRISEMIKSHATSILAMQERVTETWQQKVAEKDSVIAELKDQMHIQASQLVAMDTEKIHAVKEAKKKLYDKVQVQMNVGNLKYDTLKKSYKDSQESVQTQVLTIAELQGQLATLQGQLEKSCSDAANSSATLRSVEIAMAKLINSFSVEALESADLLQDTKIEAVFEVVQQELNAKAALVTELTTEISRLKESILLTNTNISAINVEKDELRSTLSVAQAALEAAREELASSKQEKDAQMLVIANMITEKGNVDSELEKLTLQNQELVQRCEGLRVMNDEVMSMLEKMYENKNQDTNSQ